MTPRGREGAGSVSTVGVVLGHRTADFPDIIDRLVRCCEERGVAVRRDGEERDAPAGEAPASWEDVDMVVSLGGDGTLLRAARMVLGRDIPLFGINTGTLGFLTSAPESELEGSLGRVLDGQGVLDRRFTLKATITAEDTVESVHYALNDFVVHTSGAARVTPLELTVSGTDGPEDIGSFSGDGVILATPTGSTAYSLSAGGPIVVPEVECIVVNPICPHSLAVRPLVVPAEEQITVRSLDAGHRVQLTVDGALEAPLGPGGAVVVERGEHWVSLVRLPGQTFFGTMRRKLNWAIRSSERS